MTRAARLAIALVAVVACAKGDAGPSSGGPRAPVGSGLCVTSGAVEDDWRIAEPSVRAVLPGSGGDAVELGFVYAGPTQTKRALGSGQLRRQVGLKLRAADGCNLIYAMWRFAPDASRIEVSVKRNPGDSTHAACGTRGYTKVAPISEVKIAPPAVGAAYVLGARLVGEQLEVSLDDRVVWRGSVGADAAVMQGPAGIRTDNVALEKVRLRAEPGSDAAVGRATRLPAHCAHISTEAAT